MRTLPLPDGAECEALYESAETAFVDLGRVEEKVPAPFNVADNLLAEFDRLLQRRGLEIVTYAFDGEPGRILFQIAELAAQVAPQAAAPAFPEPRADADFDVNKGLSPRDQKNMLIPVHENDEGGGRPGKLYIATAADVVGQTVVRQSMYAGTYGMGGPGFAGFELEDGRWLILRLWGATNYLSIGSRPLQAGDDPKRLNAKFTPFITDDITFGRVPGRRPQDVFDELLRLPARIESFEFSGHSGSITIGSVKLDIKADPNDRPVTRGTSEQQVFSETDDLARAWVIAPYPWVHC